jgi:3-oxoacyl-[acyl-carrier protein] reductase
MVWLMDLGLSGKIAVVAGASAGIGKAIAGALASEGATVAILSRRKANLIKAAAEIHSETGESVHPFVCDVTNQKSISVTIKKIADKLGPIGVLICNAGGPPLRRFSEMNDRDWDDAYQLNLKSTIRLCTAVVPMMQQQRWGRIISITSISALQASESLILSTTMRPGVHGFTKALSNELAPFGITVNAICPGYTNTERLVELAQSAAKAGRQTMKQIYAGWENSIPARRLAKPEEIGDLAAFLAGERAAYITGVAINIDGGFIKSI